MRNGHRQLSRKFILGTTTGFVFVLCAAMAIASPAQTLTTLYSFGGADGQEPYAGLVQGTDGNFYGTTSIGASGYGTVYKITSGGTLTTLHSFTFTDGASPYARLVQGTDGNFYGTTQGGGANGQGTVFKITPGGTLTTLYNFCSQMNCSDGADPYAGLVQGTDGNFYGTTTHGGGAQQCMPCGTVFKITPGGALTTLHRFQGSPSEGSDPGAGLTQASDGNFYGTTATGGANDGGTVFKIAAGGTLTTLYSFCGHANCTDGESPVAALVQGTDGDFYGTTYNGGGSSNCSGGCGTVFKITPGGALTTLYSFAGSDGANPYAGLVQATDGNFYGTTEYAGANGDGEVFKITPNGTLNIVHNFDGTDGCNIYAGPIQATDGNFYGTTSGCGGHGLGTVFKLSTGIVLSPVQFVAVTPCRLVDTRPQNGGSGPIQGGTFEMFNLPQLAQAKGCANLSSAATYSLNVTVVPEGRLGYLTIWPAGKSQPLVSTMNSLDGRIKAVAAIVPAGASGAVSVYVTDTANVVLDIDGYFAPAGQSTLAFYPLTPCRVADTRNVDFPAGLGPPHLSGKTARDFPVLSSQCSIPATAQAYSFNFTAIPYPPGSGHPLGYLEVWPTGEMPQDPVSTLNNHTGTVVANAAIVPAGTGGKVTAYASDDTDLAIDVNGYFAPPAQGGLSLYPVVPCRVIDTRKVGNGQPFTGERTVNVMGSVCAPPSTAQAYSFNATVVPSPTLGYLTLWPDGEPRPVVSTLNASDGAITSNMAIVPTTNGLIDAYAANGLTQLILDISSYFAP